jgi:hypothetical protein
MYTEHMWGIHSIRTAGTPRSLNLDGMLALPLPRSGLVQNCLWGAPRIHGELLKLGFTVSERTVSRYLPDRLTTPGQTWRTFLANHIGNLAFARTVTSSFETSDDDVDASVLPCRPVPPSRDGRYASHQWALVDWPPSLQPTVLGWGVAQNQLRRHTRTRFSSGKDPPQSWAAEPAMAAHRWRFPTSRNSISANERMSGRRPSDSDWVAIRKLWLALPVLGSSTSLVSRHSLRS